MKKTKTNPIELDISVDENRLDEEWVRQPRLFHRYSVELAEARSGLDEAKASLELVSAELDGEIRADPTTYGIEKVSEARLAAAILCQAEYQSAQHLLNNARHAVNVFQAAVSALDQKKSALENLVKLRLADYFSEPKAKESSRDEVEEMEKRAVRRRKKRREDE